MKEGTTVTLSCDVPRPEDWENVPDTVYYRHLETDRRIHEDLYDAKMLYRSILADHIDEIEHFD